MKKAFEEPKIQWIKVLDILTASNDIGHGDGVGEQVVQSTENTVNP